MRRPKSCAQFASSGILPAVVWRPERRFFSAENRRNFNRKRKAVLARMGTPEARRYSSHALRRGATQELKESGSPWSAVATSGICHSPAFRGCLDMSRDVEVAAQQMFDVGLDSVSEAEEEPLGLPYGTILRETP